MNINSIFFVEIIVRMLIDNYGIMTWIHQLLTDSVGNIPFDK